jgi:hypothetical protein
MRLVSAAESGDRDQRRTGEAAGAAVWTTADVAVARICLGIDRLVRA